MEKVAKKYKVITEFLIEEGLTISTMESASAGLVASMLTDTEGASAVFKGAFITYSNEAKIKQGVDSDIIDKYGVYSEKTAEAMAEVCSRAYGADIGIGVTGTYGNVDPENPEGKCGEIFFSIYYRGLQTFKKKLEPQENRHLYKLATADLIADELLKTLHCPFVL